MTAKSRQPIGCRGILFVCDCCLHARKIIEVGKAHASHQEPEELLIMGISGHGQDPDDPAMEGLIHGNNPMVAGSVLHVGIITPSHP